MDSISIDKRSLVMRLWTFIVLENRFEDAQQDKYLESLGLTVIRLLAKDILQNREGVILFLKNHPALMGTQNHFIERKF